MIEMGRSASPINRANRDTLIPAFDFMDLHIWAFILPTTSIVGSIIISMIFHFESVTQTHCRNSQWLPTVSAAVGNNAPEKYLFRFGIGTYTTVKILLDVTAYAMLKAIREHKKTKHGVLPYSDTRAHVFNRASLILVIIEDVFLCLLTMISSSDDSNIHVLSFSGFMIFAHIHFVVGLLNIKYNRSPMNEDEKFWIRTKVVFAVGHALSFLAAIYLYYRHNAYCEDGIYSIFALCEYTIIACNICFHGTNLFEWRHLKYVIMDHNLVGKDE